MVRFLGLSIVILSLIFSASCAKKKVIPPTETGSAVSGQGPAGQEQMGQSQAEAQGEESNQGQGLTAEELEAQKRLQAQKEQEEIKAIIGKRIHFDFDSFALKPEAKDILKEKAKVLLAHPKIKIVIEGHCDERGTEEYNLALGEKRAKAAYEFLILLGVDANRMQIVSYGEERPLDPRHCEEAWAKNRRDEFKIISE